MASQTQSETKTAGQFSKLMVDVGPAAVFMIAYNVGRGMIGSDAIYWATGLFMAATALALAYAYFAQKRFPPMLVVTFVIVTGFGAMTIYLQDPIFIYIKPTIINLLFSVTILVCFAFGFNVWKSLFGAIFEMPERAWFILGVRWALFFALLAFMNEVLWRHITDTVVTPDMRWFESLAWSEGFWVNFRFFATYPLFFVFLLLNLPLTMKYAKEPGGGDAEAAAD
jgi:intracellular septation protein